VRKLTNLSPTWLSRPACAWYLRYRRDCPVAPRAQVVLPIDTASGPAPRAPGARVQHIAAQGPRLRRLCRLSTRPAVAHGVRLVPALYTWLPRSPACASCAARRHGQLSRAACAWGPRYTRGYRGARRLLTRHVLRTRYDVYNPITPRPIACVLNSADKSALPARQRMRSSCALALTQYSSLSRHHPRTHRHEDTQDRF
jgi:hypothetical protein